MVDDAGKALRDKAVKRREFHAKKSLSHAVENGESLEAFNHYNNNIFSKFLETHTRSLKEDELEWMDSQEY